MNDLSTSTFPSQTAVDIGAHLDDRERARLEAIERYAILDTPPDGAFDRITRLAAQIFDAPVAICSIIDHERIWFKSAHGLDGVAELPREPGLCSSAIERDEPYVVEDAVADPRSCGNSLVTGPFGLRFYVGIPLHTNDGHNLGTLCVVDRETRAADPAKVEMLASLAKIVIDELELRLAARRALLDTRDGDAEETVAASDASQIDSLTGLGNRRAFDRDLERGGWTSATFAVISVGGAKIVADRRGQWFAEQMVRALADALRGSFRDSDRIYRISHDEFVVSVVGAGVDPSFVRSRIDSAVRTVRMVGFPEVRAATGLADIAEADSARGAFRLADGRMYAEKVAGR